VFSDAQPTAKKVLKANFENLEQNFIGNLSIYGCVSIDHTPL